LIQKYTGAVEEERWSLTIMVPVKCYYVFVTLVCLMKLLAMVRFNEVVLRRSCKESRDETVRNVVYWLQLVDVEIGFTLDCRRNQF